MQTLRDPRASTVQDKSTVERLARASIASHLQATGADKNAHPERYDPAAPRAVKAHIPGADVSQRLGLSRAGTGAPGSKVVPSAAGGGLLPYAGGGPSGTLGATFNQQSSGLVAASEQHPGHGAPLAPVGGGLTSAASLGSVPGASGALSQLSQCVAQGLQGYKAEAAVQNILNSGSVPPAFLFADAVSAPGVSELAEEAAVAVLQAIAQVAPGIGDACLAVPNGFHHTIAALMPIVNALSEDSPVFVAACSALCSVGHAMVARDPHTAHALAQDVALPLWVPLLQVRPAARHAVLQLLYAFTPANPAARLGVIRTLQERLNNQRTLLHCMSVLVFLEPDFNPALLDLYAYYAQVGATSPSPSLRAASISVLAVLVAHDPVLVCSILPALVQLCGDTWWEVQAQLLIVAAGVLQRVPSGGFKQSDGADSAEVAAVTASGLAAATDIVRELLVGDAPPAVLRVGVAHCTGALAPHPELYPVWLEALLCLPAAPRAASLDVGGEPDRLELSGASGGKYELPQLPQAWNAPQVAAALQEHVEHHDLQQLDLAVFQVLLGLLHGDAGTEGDEEQKTEGKSDSKQEATQGGFHVHPAVVESVLTLLDLVFVGLCHPDTCDLACEVLFSMVTLGGAAAAGHVMGAPTLVGSLFLVNAPPEGEPDAGVVQCTAGWLRRLSQEGPWFGDRVREVIASLRSNYGGALQGGGPLAVLASELGV